MSNNEQICQTSPLESSNNLHEIIYANANDYFDDIIDAINLAKASIDIEVYIFDDSELSKRVVEALTSASKRNVRVRLLIDGVGAAANIHDIAQKLFNLGAEVKIFHPLPWHIEQWSLSVFQRKGLEKCLHLLASINKRNHRKLILIDQQTAWLGSFNISQKHLPKVNQGEHWRDTAVKISGISLLPLQMVFDGCWFKRSKKQTASTLPASHFIFNFTRSLRIKERSALLRKIENSQNKVWITNAYFVPDKHLLNALSLASAKGVDVRIILPRHSDIFFIPWASAYFFEQLLNSGVKIFEFQQRMLHSKTLIVDNWAIIGSSNLNRRSLRHDLELDYSLQLNDSKENLSQLFLKDLKESQELDMKRFKQTRFWQRVLGGLIILLLAPWV